MGKSKKAILVVGPPRSGTSAVANVINKLGVYFGDPTKFVDPERQKHNPIFFELVSLNKINDEIFQYFLKNWSDFDWFPDRSDFSESVCSRFESAIVDFIGEEFGNSEIIGLKDPRFCYTLPLWETVLTRIGFDIIYVLVRRPSSSIFRSNESINHDSASTNFRLVVQSHILAARFVQSRPYIPIFYEELLRDPVESIRKVCRVADLPVDRIEDASSVVNRNLQHHDDSEKPLFKYFSSVVDVKHIDPEEYDRYREIYLTSIHDKNKTIEKLNLELAKIEQEMRDFPYRREVLKAASFLWGGMTLLAPHNSCRRRFAKFVMASLIKLYRSIHEMRYQNWINRFEKVLENESINILKRIQSFERKPLLSVLMPVYAPPLDYLNEAINSVRGQLYTNWELCIADDASPNPHIRDLIEKHAKEDSRIHYVFRDTNGHISASSNSALGLVNGEFTALLDHDDILHPLALYYVAEEINAHPDVEVIYSDEDLLNERGRRIIPYFKPDFDYDLLLGQNLVSHLGVYRTVTLRDVGGFRIGFEGSQDYDLVLRIIEKIEPDQIRHIPRVLYHWRVSSQSAASGAAAKPYAYEASLHALKDHLSRKKIDASVEYVPGTYSYRVRYSTPQPHPSVVIIICTPGLSSRIERCVDSILSNTRYSNYNISLYLENNLDGKDQAAYKRWSQENRVSVIQNAVETNQPQLINRAVMNSQAEFICLLDEKTEGFFADWLEQLVGVAAQTGVGATGPLLLQPNGKIFSGGVVLTPDKVTVQPFSGLPKNHSIYHGWVVLQKGYSAISDACLLVRRSHFLDVGGFNGNLLTRYYATVDLCLKLREKGLRNIITPVVELYYRRDSIYNKKVQKRHMQGLQLEKDKKYIINHWRAWLNHDPAFNPNLMVKKGRIVPVAFGQMKNNQR